MVVTDTIGGVQVNASAVLDPVSEELMKEFEQAKKEVQIDKKSK